MKTKTKTKKNFIELRIPKPSEEAKQILKIGMLAFACVGAIMFLLRILAPILLKMFQGLSGLVHLYMNNLDNINIKFFGGLAFLFIVWKCFEVLATTWIMIIEFIIKEIRNE